MYGFKMSRSKFCWWVSAVSFCYLPLLAVAQRTDPSEVNALLAVKSSLIDPAEHLKNWNNGDPCTNNWRGLLCFGTVGGDGYFHVREIQLLNMNLSGNLASELGQFSQLEILDFMWNDLTGSIPKEIGSISSLKLLLLNGNKLSGSLPDELGHLSNLNRFQVDENNISGPIPRSFGNLSKVQHLHFNNNSISGPIPVELSQLSLLLHLLLDNNNLSGRPPPQLSDLPELRILQLDNNSFHGSEIPATYGKLYKLVKLSLRNCGLQGTIPDLSGLTNLYYLDLSRNGLSGPMPSKLSYRMMTIYLSDNHLNGSIPGSFSNFSFLQTLSIENNTLSGSIPASIWQNRSFNSIERLTLDLRNNSFSNIVGDLNVPVNVTLSLGGNPVCNDASIPKAAQFCVSTGGDGTTGISNNSALSCDIQECPTDNFFEYVQASPVPCYCASPLRIGYRLKSPSFSYFPPHRLQFEKYVTESLKMDLYQLRIDTLAWEKGPRLRMYLKLFPAWSDSHSHTFNLTEVERIRNRFSSWKFRGSDFYGPYELLNFTLLGPYSQMNLGTGKANISKGVLAAIILGAIALAASISVIIISLLIARRHFRYHKNLSRRHLSSKASMKIEGVKDFTFKEMALATDNFTFSTQVGQGGYGKVYRGILADNKVVAIKRAEESSMQGQKEFLTEIKLLSRLHHRNLVSLVGYCDEECEQMLVYEFMPNGTLRDWLSAKATEELNFKMRLKIALDSARGILYLHTEAQPPVFHRDIKASNILLDSKLTAKVADFGLSRLAPALDDEGNMPNHVSTVVKGTPGYLDPEYFLTHKLTDKSDVYSLGIVFLELLTGMRPISHGKNIVREVNLAHKSGTMLSIIDSRMGSYPAECVERFMGLAIGCCNDKPEKRPSMRDAVRELENILRMLPAETNDMLSETYSSSGGKSKSTSTSTSRNKASSPLFHTGGSSSSNDVHGSSSSFPTSLQGSDLSSGVDPTIIPR